MLAITRRTNAEEALWIGDNVRIRLAPGRSPNQVRIIIEAPREVNIVREELLGRADPSDDTESADAV
ncbi:carbon storage regulator [Aquisalimonas sp. 2447]|uniref:carbon storage regulator n=1 Tax=Aquisalimonas sp. 2447 TaxID=2740807 RepID=UPI0014325B8C|nr:carbon storage regulator [Aquisalimonas sp. 2447]QIT54119.1 carbon storage regulator [Aquisalimonas sp. 2447]